MSFNFDKLHGLTGTLSKKKENELQRKVSYMQLDVELSKRVSHAQGLVYDKFDGLNEGSRAKLDMTKTLVKGAIEAGATSVEVESLKGFKVGQEVTVYDNKNSERKIIEDINVVDKSITSNVKDALVVNQAYSTEGTGGRKLVRLANGYLVSVVRDSTGKSNHYYKSKDNGATWELLYTYTNSGAISMGDVAIVEFGNLVYSLHNYNSTTSNSRLYGMTINSETNEVKNLEVIYPFSPQELTKIGNISLVVNREGTELHACWTGNHPTYPNSTNLYYMKSLINSEGNAKWGDGKGEQVTGYNSSTYAITSSSMTIDSDGVPYILFSQSGQTERSIGIASKRNIGTKFSLLNGWFAQIVTTNNSSYNQENPSAIYVPKGVNGLENGRIWVAWHGLNASHTSRNNIYVSYSDDLGVTWSTPYNLELNNSRQRTYPSITADINNNVYVVYASQDSDSNNHLVMRVHGGETWGEEVTISEATSNYNRFPSVLVDSSFSLKFTKPPCIYQSNTKIDYSGEWGVGIIEHTLEFTEPTEKSFAEKAGVARTNAEIKDGELVFGTWRGQGFIIKESE